MFSDCVKDEEDVGLHVSEDEKNIISIVEADSPKPKAAGAGIGADWTGVEV